MSLVIGIGTALHGSLAPRILGIFWVRITASLAPTNLYTQSSKKFEKNGSSVRRKRKTSAKLRTSEHALQMGEANRRPVQKARAKDRIILLDLVPSCHPSAMRQLVAKSRPNTPVEWIKCTRLKTMVRCIQDILTRLMARANKCTNQTLSVHPHLPTTNV